ncbi:hypothetical protein KI688_000535 [Linnemannia hyalina]|uniref:Chitin-binding type-4 domain-containing protein n=1 Tax=Linnemannia hyalina TaxID=64524 RepID=A0A9P8BYR6_9FUNG|nr:hypothetical protein KI688_000535 [Linnemannia hyalina]
MDHSLSKKCRLFLGILLAFTSVTVTDAHISMIYPLPRGHPFNPNTGFVDYNCRDAPLYDGCGGGIGKTFPCGGYPPDKQVVQSFNAGQVINVRFGNAQFGSDGQPQLTPSSNQARHAGGLCEFSLSYDQGKTFGVFARYHGSCPDMYYDWPVKLPENLPSCDSCIFGWSWINAAATQAEFYMGCADIKIVGKSGGAGGVLPPEIANTPLRLANMPGQSYYRAAGDQFGNAKSNGPNQAEVDANMRSATGGTDSSFQAKYNKRKRSARTRRGH